MTEGCMYEAAILKARVWHRIYAVLAVITPITAFALCNIFDEPSTWIGRSGAVMAAFAYLAERYAEAMEQVLKPGGMVNMTFSDTKKKYWAGIRRSIRLSVVLVLVGAGIWGFGDLIPVNAS